MVKTEVLLQLIFHVLQMVSLWTKYVGVYSFLLLFIYCILLYYVLCITNLRSLKWVKRKNLVLGLTQENSIENSGQYCLPYILIAHGLCSTTLAYPK